MTKIQSPNKPPAGKHNSLRSGSKPPIQTPGHAPKVQRHGVRGKAKATPKIITPTRSKVINTA